MQMLVDGEWVDVEPGVRDFTFTTDEQEDEPSEPVSTQQSWSMDIAFDHAERFGEIVKRVEAAERARRWRSRLWLTRPYRPR